MTPAGGPDDPEPPPSSARRRVAGWLIVGAVLVLQWGLFRGFAEREVTWSYPAGVDQAGYLLKSYTIHETLWTGGFAAGFKDALGTAMPQGFLLQLEAALLFLVTGPTRLSALCLNFLHFAALQCVLVLALRRLHRGWSVAALGVGLLVSAILPFQRYGGMADFRLDFAGACLFGMFAIAGVCADGFRDRRWTLATLALAVVCVWTRHIAVTYVMGVLIAFAVLAALRRAPGSRSAAKRALLAAAAVAAVSAPALWANRKALHDYYVVGHLTGGEKHLRARQFHIRTVADRFAFYPRSVAVDHAGPAFLWVAGLAAAAALVSLTPWWRRSEPAPAEPRAADPVLGLTFLALCIAVPIAVLTANESKSPVVAGVVIPPLAGLVAVGAWAALGRDAAGRRTLKVLGAIALAVGLGSYASGVVRPFQTPQDRADARTMLGVYDSLARYTRDAGWASVRVLSTSLNEHVWPPVLPVLFYERHGWLPGISMAGFTIFAPEPKKYVDAARGSDVVFLNEPLAGTAIFPFDEAMRGIYPELRSVCDRDMLLLDRATAFGAGLRVYVRPTASAEGVSGDWLTASGLRLRAKPERLVRWPRFRFSGRWMRDWLRGRTPRACATLAVDERPPVAVPARVTVARDTTRKATADGSAGWETYTVDVDVPPDAVRSATDASVDVVFDTYFTSAADPRRLVVQSPQRVLLVRADDDPLPDAPCPFDPGQPVDSALPPSP